MKHAKKNIQLHSNALTTNNNTAKLLSFSSENALLLHKMLNHLMYRLIKTFLFKNLMPSVCYFLQTL